MNTHKSQVTDRLLSTKYGKAQQANHETFTQVIDDMLTNPLWAQAIQEYVSKPENEKKSTVKTGFSIFSIFGK